MKRVRITAVRQTQYADLMAAYENPIANPCEVEVGQTWVSHEGRCPEGFCQAAWQSVGPFATALAQGEKDFYDGWMQNPYSAMVSCNDGFRPMTFYVEAID